MVYRACVIEAGDLQLHCRNSEYILYKLLLVLGPVVCHVNKISALPNVC